MKMKSLLITALCISGCAETAGDKDVLSDQTMILSAKNERQISVRLIQPETCDDCPLIIFSHGANASFDRYDALLLPMAAAGYRIAAPNHTDSEEHKTRDQYGPPDWMPTRVEDYLVIKTHFDSALTIAAGHSFGALIAQIAGGAELSNPAMPKIAQADRPTSIIAISPPGPIPGYIETAGWAKMQAPVLVVTGTTDIVPGMADEWPLHLESYNAAAEKSAYALIYENMDHYFNGAYGRETDDVTPARVSALKHLNSAIISFIENTRAGAGPAHQKWTKQTREFVEARSK